MAPEEPRPGSRAPSGLMCGVSSTKSNVFALGHSSRLSSQYLIRRHMVLHYDRVLTAKAAVDCSAPKSLMKSIKYCDQQRRERMKKDMASAPLAVSYRPRSRDSADSIIHWKEPSDPRAPLLRHSPYSDPGPMDSPSSFTSSPRHPRSPGPPGEVRGRPGAHCGLSTAWSTSCKFQDNQRRTYGGDLLEKHSHHFTSRERPFTPRTLKTQAKSALAQSRYYTPPRRKRKGAEAETQTDLSSFQHPSPESSSSPLGDQERNNENLHLSDEDEERQQRCSSRLSSSDFKSPPPPLRKIHSEEEELAYLRFVAEVTNEILTLGLFSDRVLDRVFQRHLEENRDRLDEGKMRHLLDILRADLDYKEEGSLKSLVTSPWDEASAYLDALLMGRDQLVDRTEPKSQLRAVGEDEQEDGGDLAPRLSHDHVLGSPDQMLKEPPEDNLLLDGEEQTLDDVFCSSADFSDARHVSKRSTELESLEDLPQIFSDLVHVSRADDNDILNPEEEAAQTKDHNDF